MKRAPQHRDEAASGGELIVYQTGEGTVTIHVRLEGETLWLTQRGMAELFQCTTDNISLHLRNIYDEEELSPESTTEEFSVVRKEGNRDVGRTITHYNLDAILSVGYRVKSIVATRFRQWATQRLREYLVKGFTLDDERLKGGDSIADYFDELLGRIRDIRASEARVYQRIRDIFSLAIDYQSDSAETQRFFAVMQNKMHYAATGFTAAEIIRSRADSDKPNMGLTSWKGGRVRKGDILTAKNYLNETEIDTLNRITVMFLDQAEFRTLRRQNIRMGDWETFLDKFLTDTELPVLADAGSVRHEAAQEWADSQYEAFANRRRKRDEAESEKRYLDDLRNSAKLIESNRQAPVAKSANKRTKK